MFSFPSIEPKKQQQRQKKIITPDLMLFPIGRGNPVLANYPTRTWEEPCLCTATPSKFFLFKKVSEVVMEKIQGPVPERPISANP